MQPLTVRSAETSEALADAQLSQPTASHPVFTRVVLELPVGSLVPSSLETLLQDPLGGSLKSG